MKPRNCTVVITEMLSKIPDTTQNKEFIDSLKWNRDDASYKAPEETIQWYRTMTTLQKYIPLPIEEWHFEVLSEFTTHSIDTLKLHTKAKEQ